MDDERVPSSEVTSITSNDVFQDTGSQNSEISKCSSDKRDTRDEESVRDVSATCIETPSSIADDASERLSIDIVRADNQLRPVTDVESSVDCENDLASVLRERIQGLRLEMTCLREELNREMALWREERNEFRFLRERSDALAFEEANAAARAAAVAYAIESPLSNNLSIDNAMGVTSEQSIIELAILEYEKNLAKYRDAYSFEQAEQRYNSYKRALADVYKQKLSEVEHLCNEELERLRQGANCLRSFKEIASQWSTDENDHGDSNRDCDDQRDTEQSKIIGTSFDRNDWCVFGKIDSEVNIIPEILSARYKREDTT